MSLQNTQQNYPRHFVGTVLTQAQMPLSKIRLIHSSSNVANVFVFATIAIFCRKSQFCFFAISRCCHFIDCCFHFGQIEWRRTKGLLLRQQHSMFFENRFFKFAVLLAEQSSWCCALVITLLLISWPWGRGFESRHDQGFFLPFFLLYLFLSTFLGKVHL